MTTGVKAAAIADAALGGAIVGILAFGVRETTEARTPMPDGKQRREIR